MDPHYAIHVPARVPRGPLVSTILAVVGVVVRLFQTAILFSLLYGLAYFIAGRAGLIYLLTVFLATLVVFAAARTQLHRRRVAAVFAYCSRGLRSGLPLPAFLTTVAHLESGVLRRRLLAIAHDLNSGAPLTSALVDLLPELDRRQTTLIATSAVHSSTAEVLDRLALEHAAGPTDVVSQSAAQLVYWAMVLLATSLVAWGLAIFVFPKFNQILRDFGLPPQSTGLIAALPAFLPIGLCALLFLFGIVTSATGSLAARRETSGRPDSLLASIPFLRPLFRNRALADLYHTSADAIEAGRPLESPTHPDADLATRLRAGQPLAEAARAAHLRDELTARLRSGQPLADAARAVGLPKADAALLATAQDTGQLAAAFRLLARLRTRHHRLRRQLIFNALTLLITFTSAALLLYTALAIWGPITQILTHLSKTMFNPRW